MRRRSNSGVSFANDLSLGSGIETLAPIVIPKCNIQFKLVKEHCSTFYSCRWDLKVSSLIQFSSVQFSSVQFGAIEFS